jgi:hypothetical protein
MRHPDEGMIHTWLDGELPAEEAAALEAHVAECEECKALVAEARGFIAASSRIVGTLDNVPNGVIPVAKSVKRVWYSSPQFRAAAAVLVVAGASLLLMKTGTQKATLSELSRPAASEAATQSDMAASGQTAMTDSVVLQAPVAADKTVANAAAPKPAIVAPPKGLAILKAPAEVSVPLSKVANEEDFNGKGVKGGSANGVAGGVPQARDTAALLGRVAGVTMRAAGTMSPRAAFVPAPSELKVIRVDSSAAMKKTTYESPSGKEVILTEQEPSPVMSKVATSADEKRERAARPSTPPAVANAPVASAAVAQQAVVVNTISWVDPVTRRRYSLSGRVPVTELEAIKVRLLQTKH